MPVVQTQNVQSRIDKIINQVTGQFAKQNAQFQQARQAVISNGLVTPQLQTAPDHVGLAQALGNDAGLSTFLTHNNQPITAGGFIPGLAQFASSIGPAIGAASKDIGASIDKQNQQAIQQANAKNANTLALLKLQQPTGNIGAVLQSLTSQANNQAHNAALLHAANIRAKAKSGPTLANVLSAANLIGKRTPVDPTKIQDVLSSGQVNAGDINVQHITSKNGSKITLVNAGQAPISVPVEALTTNEQVANNYNQDATLAANGLPTGNVNTTLIVNAPRKNDSAISSFFTGSTPNIYATPEQYTPSPQDFPFIQPLLKQHGYDVLQTLNTINQLAASGTKLSPQQAQAFLNFKQHYEPSLAALIKGHDTVKQPPLNNLSNRQFK